MQPAVYSPGNAGKYDAAEVDSPFGSSHLPEAFGVHIAQITTLETACIRLAVSVQPVFPLFSIDTCGRDGVMFGRDDVVEIPPQRSVATLRWCCKVPHSGGEVNIV